MSSPATLRVDQGGDGRRVDAFVASRTELSRARVQALIGEGRLSVDGRPACRSSLRVRLGQTIVLDVPPTRDTTLVAEAIPLEIVHEDSDLVVLDKPAGMVVHPAPGHAVGTLVNALLHHCEDLSGIGGELRPGIVHRLDKDTSGLLVVSKNDATHQHLQAQFSARTIERTYLALCVRTSGPGLAEEGSFETCHGRHPTDRRRFTGRRSSRRAAVTHYRVTGRFVDGACSVSCRLETGRTHQIRMHLSEAGCPILGDRLYGGRAVAATRLVGRLALHAATLGFEHPSGEVLYFEAAPPEDFTRALEQLERGLSWRS